MSVSRTVSEIFGVKEWRDLATGGRLSTNRRQIGVKSTVDFVADLSPALATVDFVASVYRG